MGIREKFRQIKNEVTGSRATSKGLRSELDDLEKTNAELRRKKRLKKRKKKLLDEKKELEGPNFFDKLRSGAQSLVDSVSNDAKLRTKFDEDESGFDVGLSEEDSDFDLGFDKSGSFESPLLKDQK